MDQTTQEQDTNQQDDILFVEEGSSFEENFLRNLIVGYQAAFNKHNPTIEIRYELTITIHKVATPEGNKDAAYLRLSRGRRPKGASDEEWEWMLIHQQPHFFKSLKEQLNPAWREKLYLDCIARVFAGGLEYAELLKKMKQIEQAKQLSQEQTEEQRLNNLGLVSAKEMPAPLTESDKQYKEWLANERAKENIK